MNFTEFNYENLEVLLKNFKKSKGTSKMINKDGWYLVANMGTNDFFHVYYNSVSDTSYDSDIWAFSCVTVQDWLSKKLKMNGKVVIDSDGKLVNENRLLNEGLKYSFIIHEKRKQDDLNFYLECVKRVLSIFPNSLLEVNTKEALKMSKFIVSSKKEERSVKKVEMKGNLRNLMRRFSNGKANSYKDGDWSVAVGGYDLWFEVYFKGMPVFGCVAGKLSCYNSMFSESDAKKYMKIICEEYDGINNSEDFI